MGNLFAICRNADKMSVRRIILDNTVNQKIEGLFAAQEAAFTSGVNEETEFSGDWKPDPDELLTLKVDSDIEQVVNILKGDVHAVEPLKPKSFMNDGIKGIAYVKSQDDPTHILIQNFTAQQILRRGMTLYSSGDTFNELSESAFVLDDAISTIIIEDRIKFKSFFLLKRIFPLNEIYQEATNPQIEEFCSHANLHVESVESFKEQADQVVRKLVSAKSRSDILSEIKVDDIKKIAMQMGIPIEVQNGRIVMPALRKELKIMLRFLDDKIYEAPLTKYKYMTNSAKLLA